MGVGAITEKEGTGSGDSRMLQGTLDPSLGDTEPPLPPLQHSKVGKEVVGAHPELAFLTNPLPVPCTVHLSWEAWGRWPWDSRKGWVSLLRALSPPIPPGRLADR